jgi:hypothetical protein
VLSALAATPGAGLLLAAVQQPDFMQQALACVDMGLLIR